MHSMKYSTFPIELPCCEVGPSGVEYKLECVRLSLFIRPCWSIREKTLQLLCVRVCGSRRTAACTLVVVAGTPLVA